MRAMNDPDLQRQLDALMIGLMWPVPTRRPDGSESDEAEGADPQLASLRIDGLLAHVSALLTALGTDDSRGWDQIDDLAARLLISDLAAFASITRALNRLAASRLADALTDLRAAGADVQRALEDAASS
jgi:hypothetical protein